MDRAQGFVLTASFVILNRNPTSPSFSPLPLPYQASPSIMRVFATSSGVVANDDTHPAIIPARKIYVMKFCIHCINYNHTYGRPLDEGERD